MYMTPIRIYLGDLTYDTVALSTESFPLNIGYLAAFAQAEFADDIDIRKKYDLVPESWQEIRITRPFYDDEVMSKYITDLETSMSKNPRRYLQLLDDQIEDVKRRIEYLEASLSLPPAQ